jgi:hypothetical protein
MLAAVRHAAEEVLGSAARAREGAGMERKGVSRSDVRTALENVFAEIRRAVHRICVRAPLP